MKKICRICGKEFETIKNGGSRQFCFECVPEGLTTAQRTTIKRQSAKKAGVNLLGGKCLKCGIEKHYLLDFHHLDKTTKDGTPSKMLADSKIEEFFLEIQKCALLCSNCHQEFHYLEANENIDIETYLEMSMEEIMQLNQKSAINRGYQRQEIYCKECGASITRDSVSGLCRNCLAKSKRVVERPTKNELLNKLIELKGNFTQAGILYGVSDNAVRKWCKNYQIPHKSSEYKNVE